MKRIIILSSTFIILIGSYVGVSSISASQCTAPYYIPSGCESPYVPGQRAGYTADLNCQLEKLVNPGSDCCPNICVDRSGNPSVSVDNPDLFWDLEVFGTLIRINPENTPVLVNILFTTALGIVSLYVIIRGIYVTGVKRPMAITPEEIAEINKELTNLVIGAIICWGFIILIQVVANLLGVGSLGSLDFSGGSSGSVITIN